MKTLLIFILAFLIPYYLKAQNSAIGKSKEEVRASLKDNILPFILVSKSDTSEVFNSAGDWEWTFVYKENICYKSTVAFPLNYSDELHYSFDQFLKKLEENVWTDEKGIEKIELFETKDKCVLSESRLDGK
jgi:hypothetical protein